VYFTYKNKKNFQYNYIKMYNDKPMVVIANFSGVKNADKDLGLFVKTWYEVDNEDAIRKGILIKKR